MSKLSILLSLALLLGSSTSNAALINVQNFQQELKSKQLGWKAKDNWVNQLSVEQVQRMMGYKKKVRLDKEVLFTARMGANIYGTEALDWRNKDGQNWVSPVLNQGNCGSCVAFATVATLETQMNIHHQVAWLNPKFSTEALFACGGGGCESGWWPSSATEFLKSTGVPDEACAPYTMGATGQDVSCNSICLDSASRSQKVSEVTTPSGSIETVKAALRNGPLVTTLDVYADFVVYSSGIYKHSKGEYLGGHAVSIVGFNDAERYWLVRNSWGTDWGDNGFVKVSYDDTSGISDETWGFQIPSTEGLVAIRNLHDRDFITMPYSFQTVSTCPNTTQLTLSVVDSAGKESTVNCSGSSCSTMSLPQQDGRYEMTLKAYHGTKDPAVSEKKYFYVVNKQPSNMQIAFKGASGVDLAKALMGRVVFDIDINSAPVPLSSVKLVVKQGAKVVYTKGSENVLPQMTLGWRTITVPNGKYSISIEGIVQSDKLNFKTQSNSFDITVQN